MTALWIALTMVVLAAGAGAWWYFRKTGTPGSGREDRYTPERVLTPEQVSMLDYLRNTFPDKVVLPNVALKDMLSVRKAEDRKGAMERLRNQKVDFVVCDGEGHPVFAFDVEQYHLSDAKTKSHMVKIKNRILKTAGVRFLHLKNSIQRMPRPEEFRRQLDIAVLPRPKQQQEADPVDSARQRLEAKMSDYDKLIFQNTGFRESEVMGLSGLMNLADAKNDRKSQRDRQIEAVRRRA